MPKSQSGASRTAPSQKVGPGRPGPHNAKKSVRGVPDRANPKSRSRASQFGIRTTRTEHASTTAPMIVIKSVCRTRGLFFKNSSMSELYIPLTAVKHIEVDETVSRYAIAYVDGGKEGFTCTEPAAVRRLRDALASLATERNAIVVESQEERR